MCPGEKWKLEDDRTIDICSLAGKEVLFNVGIPGSGLDQQVGYYNFNDVNFGYAPPYDMPIIECKGHPKELYFVFNERLCIDSENSLDSNWWRRELLEEESNELTEEDVASSSQQVLYFDSSSDDSSCASLFGMATKTPPSASSSPEAALSPPPKKKRRVTKRKNTMRK